MQTKKLHHTFTRDGRFYFSLRVPADLIDHYKVPRIVRALGTSSPIEARKLVTVASAQLEAYWANIRLTRTEAIGHDLRVMNGAVAPNAKVALQSPAMPAVVASITISEARDLYLRQKGKGRPPTFKRAADRSTAYLVETCGEKPLNHYTRSDALRFRDYLLERGHSGSTVTRNFSHVNAIINFAVSENAIDMKNPFIGVYYDRASGVVERQPIPVDVIRHVQSACRMKDDQIRWLVALVSDTGMRLAEAAGLVKTDLLDLDGPIPYVEIQPHPWRSLKTDTSKRIVPLVGASLWAAQRIMETDDTSQFAFPRYNKGKTTNANSASAGLNKWLGEFVPNGCTMHSFRHSMRDRLRAVECPSDIVDQIGGWTTEGVGQGYGNGYPIEIMNKWMRLLETS